MILRRNKKRKPPVTSTTIEGTGLKKSKLMTPAGADGTQTKATVTGVAVQPASTGDGRARFIAYTGADAAAMGMKCALLCFISFHYNSFFFLFTLTGFINIFNLVFTISYVLQIQLEY